MGSFWYYAWYSIFILLSSFFPLIINCINLCNILQLCKYYVGGVCKKKRDQMWKHVMNLVLIQWKWVSNTKQEWSLTIELKILKLYIYHINFWFFMKYFLPWVFNIWECTLIFFIVFGTHLRCYTISDVHLIICALCVKKSLKELVNWKRKYALFFSMFFLCIFLFYMCFDHFTKFCASKLLLYNTSHMISTHLYLFKHVLNDMGIHLSIERETN
jgi:hypothetical protein